MSRLHNSQLLIFASTFLLVSLVINVTFFIGNERKAKQIDEQNDALQKLEKQLTGQDFDRQQQQLKLNTMDGQQEELASYIKDLQTQLSLLQVKHQENRETSELAQNRLAQSIKNAESLDRKLRQLTTDLSEANKTISNQQRYIKSLSSGSQNESNPLESADTHQAALAEFSTQVGTDFSEISVTQASDGQALIHIPLNYLFNSENLLLTDQAEAVLTPVAELIKSLATNEITVVGHSDARPIVSDLAKLYPTNWELSSMRASKIVTYLINAGVSSQRLTAAGKAANAPVRDDANPDAWQMNRRIEIRIHR